MNDLKKDIVVTKLNYLFDLEKENITSQKFKVIKEEYVKKDKNYVNLKKVLNLNLEISSMIMAT